MFESCLRITFRHLATLGLAVAIVVLPLHLIYGFAFREVIALGDLHPAMAGFPPGRLVRGIGILDIERAGYFYLGLCILEAALALVMVGMGRAAIEADERDRDLTIGTALRAAPRSFDRTHRGAFFPTAREAGVLAAIVLFAVFVGFLIERTGLPLARSVVDQDRWAALAVIQTAARALAAPFVLVTLAAIARGAKARRGVTPTTF